MWDEVGIVRSDCGLAQAQEETERMVREIEALYSEHRLDAELVQLRSLTTVAQLIARSAQQRLESRASTTTAIIRGATIIAGSSRRCW